MEGCQNNWQCAAGGPREQARAVVEKENILRLITEGKQWFGKWKVEGLYFNWCLVTLVCFEHFKQLGWGLGFCFLSFYCLLNFMLYFCSISNKSCFGEEKQKQKKQQTKCWASECSSWWVCFTHGDKHFNYWLCKSFWGFWCLIFNWVLQLLSISLRWVRLLKKIILSIGYNSILIMEKFLSLSCTIQCSQIVQASILRS